MSSADNSYCDGALPFNMSNQNRLRPGVPIIEFESDFNGRFYFTRYLEINRIGRVMEREHRTEEENESLFRLQTLLEKI